MHQTLLHRKPQCPPSALSRKTSTKFLTLSFVSLTNSSLNNISSSHAGSYLINAFICTFNAISRFTSTRILKTFRPLIRLLRPYSGRPTPGAYAGEAKRMVQRGYLRSALRAWRAGVEDAWSPGRGYQLYIRPRGSVDDSIVCGRTVGRGWVVLELR